MKKIIMMLTGILIAFSLVAHAEKIDESQIKHANQIGSLFEIHTISDEKYVADGDYNIIGGPYRQIANQNDYCDVIDMDGSKILFDKDGSIIMTAPENYDINTPKHGIFTVREREEDDTAELIVYDYETKKELLRTTGGFLYYLEQQSDKMFIKSNGKYAIVDNKCNFITDYIYDDVKKRFNPDYVPFPKSYAIVVQGGVEKYIDWDLNEINLDDYNGKQFITDCYQKYEDYYELKSGEKTAIYNINTGEYLIPYQTEYKFGDMNDKYIIVTKDEKKGVIDYSGNIVVPFSNSSYYFNNDGQIAYNYSEGGTVHMGVINPEDGVKKPVSLGSSGLFYNVIGETYADDISSGVIVSGGKAADIRTEDLKNFLQVYWNFGYERVITPSLPSSETYIKIWNKDKTKSYIINEGSGVVVGTLGEPSVSHGTEKKNYVIYLPMVGNGRNALYTAFETVRHTYFDENYEGYIDVSRDITEADNYNIPENNILPIDGCSDWAKPEIQKAAACNLLVYELTDKYTENITRYDFCKLAYRTIATEFSPNSDSRMGVSSVWMNILEEKGLSTNYDMFTDCHYPEVISLAAAGIIEGMGDGTFAPDAHITREQAATILYRMAKFLCNKTIPEIPQNQYYYDLDKISDWAFNAVRSMYLMGIMHGDDKGYFNPQDNYTVEQAIATMLRMYECY